MSITAIAIAIGAFLAAIIGAYLKGNSSGASKQKAKEAEARDQNLKRIKAAADAGNRPPDIVSDPHNRDNR